MLKVDVNGAIETWVGVMPPVVVGIRVRGVGRQETNAKFGGEQFKTESVMVLHPRTLDGIERTLGGIYGTLGYSAGHQTFTRSASGPPVTVADGTTVRRYLRVVDTVTGAGTTTRQVSFARR